LSDQDFCPVKDRAFESFARIEETRRRMARLVQELNLRRVLLIDWGKNMPAYRMACESAGVRVVAVADPVLAGRSYHGIPVVGDEDASRMHFDAAIVANLSPAHAEQRLTQWHRRTGRPVIDLFEADRVETAVRAAA
jgi:hypothetical protein